MQKKIGVILIVILVLFSQSIEAEERKLELDAGLTGAYFSLDDINRHLRIRNNYLSNYLFDEYSDFTRDMSSMNLAFGYSVRGRHWLNDYLAVGTEFESSELSTEYTFRDYQATYYYESYNLSLVGLLALLTFRANLNIIKLDFKLGIGPYQSTLAWKQELDFQDGDTVEHRRASYTGESIGSKMGVEFVVPYRERMDLKVGFNYHYLIFDELRDQNDEAYYSIYGVDMSAEEFDFTGFGFNSSINVNF